METRQHVRNVIAVLLICFIVVIPVQPSDAGTTLEGFSGFIQDVLDEWRSPGAAIAIIKDGEMIFEEGFGYRNVENRLPVTTNTLFAIGSCTKAFTTTLIGMLVDDGLLDWDSPVRDYLPEFRMDDPYITENITIRDLVTHRSGLPRHEHVWLGTPFTRESLVERIQHLQFSKGFREVYQYNNLHYVTAGKVIEAVTGSTWEDVVYKRILLPLGMTSTNFSVTDLQLSKDHARAYTVAGRGHAVSPFRNVDALGPAGSINSTLRDMAKWVQFNLSNGIVMLDTLIHPDQLKQIHSPWVVASQDAEDEELSFSTYGLGWRISAYRGNTIVYHSGAIGGFRAYVLLLPAKNLGIVSLVNVNRSQINPIIAYHTIDRLLGLEPIDWGKRFKERMEPPEEVECHDSPHLTHSLDAYTGIYEHPAYGEFKIEQRGNRLAVTRYGATSSLIPCKFNMFYREPGHWGAFRSRLIFTFDVDEQGRIDRVLLPLESSVDDIEFMRTQ